MGIKQPQTNKITAISEIPQEFQNVLSKSNPQEISSGPKGLRVLSPSGIREFFAKRRLNKATPIFQAALEKGELDLNNKETRQFKADLELLATRNLAETLKKEFKEKKPFVKAKEYAQFVLPYILKQRGAEIPQEIQKLEKSTLQDSVLKAKNGNEMFVKSMQNAVTIERLNSGIGYLDYNEGIRQWNTIEKTIFDVPKNINNVKSQLANQLKQNPNNKELIERQNKLIEFEQNLPKLFSSLELYKKNPLNNINAEKVASLMAQYYFNTNSGNMGTEKLAQFKQNIKNLSEFSERIGVKRPKVKGVAMDDLVYEKPIQSFIDSFMLQKLNPNIFTRLVKSNENAANVLPWGVVLHGPGGTGKSVLPEALSKALGVEYVKVSATELIGEYVGQYDKPLREGFDKFSKLGKNAIICIEEADAIFAKPTGGDSSGKQAEVRAAALNSVEALRKARPDINLFITTNRLDQISEEIIRPGRFDTKLQIDLPTQNVRENLFNKFIKNYTVDKDNINTAQLAKITDGFSPAKIENVMKKALSYAASEQSPTINQNHVIAAINELANQ